MAVKGNASFGAFIRRKALWVAGGVLVLVVDLLLLASYFENSSDVYDEDPLPQNDFSRLLGTVHPSSPRPHFKALQNSKCDCDPLNSPSSLVRCFIDDAGLRQTRIKGDPMLRGRKRVVAFQCATLDGTRRCQCCDCSHEVKSISFDASSIKVAAEKCTGCAVPSFTLHNRSALFGAGARNQMLFALPLALKYDYSACFVEIVVRGNFTKSLDNDPIVGLADGYFSCSRLYTQGCLRCGPAASEQSAQTS